MIKVLLVADWHGGGIYAQAMYDGFGALGLDMHKFSWKEYFHHYQFKGYYPIDNNPWKSVYYRFQNKFIFGPVLWKINRDLLKKCKDINPDLLFIYRGTHIYPRTLMEVKKKCPECFIFGYNNDDPFSVAYPKYLWRLYKRGLSMYDHLFAYRAKNIEDYRKLGFLRTSVLKPYYVRQSNYPYSGTDAYACDVCFIGHYEGDGRDTVLLQILKSGINLKLFGTDWQRSPLYQELVDLLHVPCIQPVYSDYNLAISSAKIALVFLSKLNNDVYTRRCFEIPATKTMMLCIRTESMLNMFKEDHEAAYFSGTDECIEKIFYYLQNGRYAVVGENGYLRLIRDRHEVTDRCEEVLKIYNTYLCVSE